MNANLIRWCARVVAASTAASEGARVRTASRLLAREERTQMGTEPRFESAWRVPSRTHEAEYGVLVRCGPPERPYWWLLCPATATLYIDGGSDALRDCRDGEWCDWTDVHEDAVALHRRLTESRVTTRAVSAPRGAGEPDANERVEGDRQP